MDILSYFSTQFYGRMHLRGICYWNQSD